MPFKAFLTIAYTLAFRGGSRIIFRRKLTFGNSESNECLGPDANNSGDDISLLVPPWSAYGVSGLMDKCI